MSPKDLTVLGSVEQDVASESTAHSSAHAPASSSQPVSYMSYT